ncbi:MAG: hypothetical protein PF486_00570 [Prolixibacteraceae bacterium]|jgi:hypothetical protein|nr:hypothetical protein [Prolixibacteraceae bacterium]
MKNLFTITLMFLFVALAGNVFAQSSSPVTPAEGGTFNYVIGNLTDDDTYIWGIELDADGVCDYVTNAGNYTVTSSPSLGNTGTVSGQSASLTVQWTLGASGQNYYVWIEIIDSDGCSTFRALPVNPIDAPTSYSVDFTVIAMNSTGDENTTAGDITGGVYQVNVSGICPSFVGEDWVSDSGIDEATTDGNTYVYFRVNRYSDPGTTSGWNITPNVSGASTWEVATDASGWTPMNSTQTVTTGDILYVRATVTNSTTQQAVGFDIGSSGQDAGGVYTDDDSIGVGSESNSASVTLDPLPTVGTFGGSY